MNPRPTPVDIQGSLFKALAESRGSSVDEARGDVGAGGEIDSLEGVELVVAAEELFGVSIGDDELPLVSRSIPRLVDLVSSKIDEQRKEEGRQ